MLLTVIGVGTTHWFVSTFAIAAYNHNNISVDASIGFLKFCFQILDNTICINLTPAISAPAGLLIVGLLILVINTIVSLVLAFIKVPPLMTFLPVILLFLASIFTIAGASISWYYLFTYLLTTLSTIIVENNLYLPTVAIVALVQGITVGYSYNLSIAGHFFTFTALAIAAFMSGQARVK